MTKRKRGPEFSAVSDFAGSLSGHNGEGEHKANGQEEGRDLVMANDQEWQDVDPIMKKKLKKLAGSYPAITHARATNQNFAIKLADVQNLVLYILADGPAPQWVSVRHHHNFDKIVVLMVPGLEGGLFTGSIPLEEMSREANGNDHESLDQEGTDEQEASGTIEGAISDQVRAVIPAEQRPRKPLVLDDVYPSKLADTALPAVLTPFTNMFPYIWSVKAPGDFRRVHSPMYAMLSAPIPRTKEEKSIKGVKPPAESKAWKNVRTPITSFIASRSELLENGFAIHPAHLHTGAEAEAEKARRYKNVQSVEDGWIDLLDIKDLTEGDVPESEIESGSILCGRQLFVIDCEMVTTMLDQFSLARISLVDWDGKIVMDELVKQPAPVKDYLTQYSGITEELLKTATMTLPDIQARLADMLTPCTILAGHSLDSDLRALKASYPFVIDTSLLYPHPKGPPQKSGLKWLTSKYLSRDIQQKSGDDNKPRGHDSVEDARACLDLIRQKCEKGKAWGTPEAQGESIFRRLARTGRPKQTTQPSHRSAPPPSNASTSTDGEAPARTSAYIDRDSAKHGFGTSATVATSCTSDEEVVASVICAIQGDDGQPADDSAHFPPGGCDLVFGRLRSLEFYRQWTSPPAAPRSNPSPADPPASNPDDDTPALTAVVAATVSHVQQIHAALPPRTALIVLSGSGDPRESVRQQARYAAHKAEFLVKKWDELETKWTDEDEQKMRRAAEKAKRGIGFITVSEDDNLWLARKKARLAAEQAKMAGESAGGAEKQAGGGGGVEHGVVG